MHEEHMASQHDTDGGEDRAARRKELKKAFHKAAQHYAAWLLLPDSYGEHNPEGGTLQHAMVLAYTDWKECH